MRRGPKPERDKAGKPPAARKSSPKSEGARVRDPDKRLAEALRDKAEALRQNEREEERESSALAPGNSWEKISSRLPTHPPKNDRLGSSVRCFRTDGYQQLLSVTD